MSRLRIADGAGMDVEQLSAKRYPKTYTETLCCGYVPFFAGSYVVGFYVIDSLTLTITES